MIERTNVPGLGQPPGYSHVAVASGGRLVTTAGAVPLGPAGDLVGPGDCVAQAEQVLDNLTLALGAVGAKGSDVLKTTVYVASENREDLAAVWRVIQGWPARRARSWASPRSVTRGNWSRSRPSPCWSSARSW